LNQASINNIQVLSRANLKEGRRMADSDDENKKEVAEAM